ncbi:MAG: S9 family peptidase, partial [Candidatus Limnocylindrales bacterium]
MTTPTPLWQRRFLAPIIGFPTWSRHAPDRIVYVSSESGIYQLHSWDRASGERRQITSEPVGLVDGEVSADGEWVLWHRDTTGSEAGEWVTAPFSGGTAEPLADGFPAGWDQGLAPGLLRTVAAISTQEAFGVYVAERDGSGRRLAVSSDALAIGSGWGGPELGGLSADETLVAIEHAEHGGLIHPALRVLDARTGAVVGDLQDVGRSLSAQAWSPVPGDQRLAIGHERHDEEAVAIWDLGDGTVTEFELPWTHPTDVADWWPDASALLLVELDNG